MASLREKRRRQRREDSGGEPEFQVAPMVDVLLVLMLFFMSITSTELLQKEKNLTLADAKHGKDEKALKKHEVTINVTWSPVDHRAAFSMNGLAYANASDLQTPLADQMKRDPRTTVLIRADRDVQYSNVADLMRTCASAQIAMVNFAVISGGTKKS